MSACAVHCFHQSQSVSIRLWEGTYSSLISGYKDPTPIMPSELSTHCTSGALAYLFEHRPPTRQETGQAKGRVTFLSFERTCDMFRMSTHLYFPKEVGEPLQPIAIEALDRHLFPHEPPPEHRSEPSPAHDSAVWETRTGRVDLLVAAQQMSHDSKAPIRHMEKVGFCELQGCELELFFGQEENKGQSCRDEEHSVGRWGKVGRGGHFEKMGNRRPLFGIRS